MQEKHAFILNYLKLSNKVYNVVIHFTPFLNMLKQTISVENEIAYSRNKTVQYNENFEKLISVL